MPDVLYEEVIEVEERVILRQDSCQLPRNEPKRIVTGEQHVNIYYIPRFNRSYPEGLKFSWSFVVKDFILYIRAILHQINSITNDVLLILESKHSAPC